ncbi:LysR family transcriptional regulator [Belnapia sp. T6]|uniref:LysR family transcriptional regulator n=1 Tax=Belnapia mucosa TaxID=2804532 RepID=A0ABS1V5Z6_9PROT|nr:LysR substrate-binding domain-containing protein [Belnapia mucosa]MBL6457109.1 LysR family transcriptional regulator [Belnapia mucosa]
MNARQIEVFRTIMRCGTLTGAAQALHVSQPALSQLLLHAEDQLGFKLFQRLAGRLVPTPEAELLFPEAERLHRDLEAFRRHAAALRGGTASTLRLAASAPPALSFVPAALQAFRQAWPETRLVSFVVPVQAIVEKLEQGEADLGIAMNDTGHAAIQPETIGSSEVICVLPAGHRLAALEEVGPADLQEETLIAYRRDTLPGMRLDAVFAAAGVPLRPQVEIDVSIIALAFVQAGIGIALVDGLIPWAGFAGIVARPFRPLVPLPISLLVPTRRPWTRQQATLREELRRSLAAQAADPAHRGRLRLA